MIRRPPRSPLFPSTTLSRSARARLPLSRGGGSARNALRAAGSDARNPPRLGRRQAPAAPCRPRCRAGHVAYRSEEHTSELQSRQYLVCRLLLEKKKKSYNCQGETRAKDEWILHAEDERFRGTIGRTTTPVDTCSNVQAQ